MAADAGGKAQLRRTRTGCFKCRVRRRKCDEKKPSCQRCLDGGFNCQYGTKLSFLDKNALTAPNAQSGKASRKSYSALRFVHADADVDSPLLGDEPKTDLHADGTVIRKPTFVLPRALNNRHSHTSEHASGLFQSGNVSTVGIITQPQAQPQKTVPVVPQTPGVYHANTSPRNVAYETALDVLLSLGTDNTTNTTKNTSVHTDEVPELVPPYSVETPLSVPIVEAAPPDYLEEFPNCEILPQDRVIQLLRHYRYAVAPWLDIGDSEQTFGLQVARVAMTSPPILEALLALSLTSHYRGSKGVTIPNNAVEQISIPGMGVLESIVVVAFYSIRHFASTTPFCWQSPFSKHSLQDLNSALRSDGIPSIRLAVSWALLRLDVAVALTTNSGVSIPSILPFGVQSPVASETPINLVDHAREPLYLCAKVLNQCFGHETMDPNNMHQRPGTAQNWKILADELNLWFNNRHKDFLPMFEHDESNQLFPLILFTNGSATLANQLYHTAMLLLLQNRPRTLRHERGRFANMSPLWHAQRICGICLNNDSRSSWDFSLIGSLYFAAKRMTYGPQQQAILTGVNRISDITGWDLSSVSAQLIHDWQPD